MPAKSSCCFSCVPAELKKGNNIEVVLWNALDGDDLPVGVAHLDDKARLQSLHALHIISKTKSTTVIN
jgi:hypothetical protein